MRGFLVVCTVLLGEASLVAQFSSEILKKAVSQAKMCDFEPKKADLNKNPITWEVAKPDDSEKVKSLTLGLMFREGRYTIDPALVNVPGSDQVIVQFSPRESGRLKAARGEDENLNRVLNNLSGKVYIDNHTGGVVGVSAEMNSEPLSFWYKIIPRAVKLESVDLTLEQKQVGNTWLPVEFNLKLGGTFIKWGDFYRGFKATFHCSSVAE